jgi:hypothetical protein
MCCQNDALDKRNLADLYIDILTLEQKYSHSIDSILIYKEITFKKYSISEKSYLNEINKLGDDKDEWEEFFQYVYAKLDTFRTKAEKKDSTQLKIK